MGVKRRFFYMKPVAVYLAVAFLIMTSIPTDSLAYIVQSSETSLYRSGDRATVQRVLESKVVSQRLSELGLSVDEVTSRLDKLSDQELHSFATTIDNLYPGGDAVSVVIGLLIIAILVMILLHMTGRKIVIK
ncbi:MAG: PA2779 family protein [Deltaproteobacteria bacterium]|jgi:hypothetical protein|nr:PA2779 family protein [Deltaproteobacteria bacterium]